MLVAVLTATPRSSPAQGIAAIKVSEPDEVEFSRDTRIGSALLTRGRYQLQHQWFEARHYLIVRASVPPSAQEPPQANTIGSEVARVRCRVVPRNDSPSGTGVSTTLEADGTTTLTEVSIHHERRAHVLVAQRDHGWRGAQ